MQSVTSKDNLFGVPFGRLADSPGVAVTQNLHLNMEQLVEDSAADNRSNNWDNLSSGNSFEVCCPVVDKMADARQHVLALRRVQEVRSEPEQQAVQLVQLQPGKTQGSSIISHLVN